MQKWTNETPIRPTFWNRHKGVILGSLATVAIATVVVQRVDIGRKNQYLLDKGLVQDYYEHRQKK